MKNNPLAPPNLVTFNALMDSFITCADYEGCANTFH